MRYDGETKYIEHKTYQKETRKFVLYTNILADDEKIEHIDDATETVSFSYFTAADFTETPVTTELTALLNIPETDIVKKHKEEWEKIWTRYGITVKGDDKLATAIHTSLFFLISSLPSLETNQPRNVFYGLSPSGLGRGGKLLAEYQGHNFWDTEMWMHPPILLLEPKWSAEILNYRFVVRQAAKDNAKETGFMGLRFPWESGYTGVEVTPVCCLENAEELHVIGDIAFAVRAHLYATHDMNWMKEQGCEFAVETAKFWASKVVYNEDGDYYEILDIIGPDEDHQNVNNNAFTNVVAGYNLYFGEYVLI